MRPRFNSQPHRSNQTKTDGVNTSAPQQVMPSNNCHGNQGNPLPNSSQFQSQIGIINTQTGIPFNNSNTHLGNGNKSMPNGPVSTPPTCFMNPPNHFFPLQSGVMPNGFGQNLNPFAVFQNMNSVQNMNGMNSSQPPGQFFSPSAMNPPQFLNLPNGQFCMQNPMQNMNPFVQMQPPNFPQSQVLPFNLQMFPNQGAQPMGTQSPMFISNQQFGMVNPNGAVQPGNQNEHKFVPPMVDANSLKQTPNAQQTQQKNFRPPFTQSQGTTGQNSGRNNSSNNLKNSWNGEFTRNPGGNASPTGFHNSQLHCVNSAKEKFGFHNAHGPKGHNNNRGRKSDKANYSNQAGVEKRRSLCLNYTEAEIKRWREERRKNFPSKANVDKKLTDSEISDRDAKMRRQQLKEILAKQAELGIEVAEIPSSYLSDSAKQANGRDDSRRVMTKKERFQNKFNKRGRFRQNDRFTKKQRFADNNDSSNVHDHNNPLTEKQGLADNSSSNKREPTLLEKLLRSDIRREKSCLLQVFRFMVMNSFFKDLPDKPLRFPSVVVKENSSEDDVIEEKSSVLANGISSSKTMIE